MNEDLFSRIVSIASAVFGLPQAQFIPQSSPETIENWDSLNHLMLMMALEQHFGLEFDSSEIEQMLSLEMIEKTISSKKCGVR